MNDRFSTLETAHASQTSARIALERTQRRRTPVDRRTPVIAHQGTMVTMNQMELPKEELDRMMFFEEARKRAEADHKANPRTRRCIPRPNATRSARSNTTAGSPTPLVRTPNGRPQIYPP